MTRRFGREATTYLAEPLLAGIHAGDVDSVSRCARCSRASLTTEQKYGSLLRAFSRGPRPAAAPDGAPRAASEGAFKSLPGGLSELVRALVAALPRRVDSVSRRPWSGSSASNGERPYRVQTSHRAHLTTRASPSWRRRHLRRRRSSETSTPNLARLCGEVPYASTATVVLGFTRETSLTR